MTENYYKVDLHVHTPASSCYKGEKTDESYWNILKNASKNNISAIAITDHNTIEGYEHFMKLKSDTFNEYEIVKRYNISEEDKKEIEEKVELFKNVTIFLGVEFTLNPGVHIIVLCDEAEKEDLNELLIEVGYTPDKRGSKEEITPNLDIKAFLNNSKLEGKIIIAPHVDSANGIWKELNGKYREEIFKSSRIAAITCNSASQLSKIQELVCSQPGYIRKKAFAYINASDAHEPNLIGAKYSFFKMNGFTFYNLKTALDSPEEYISDSDNPGFRDYIDKCVKGNPAIHLDSVDELPKAMCAVLNNGYGCILLGIKKGTNSLLGISIDKEDLSNQIYNSVQRLNAINHRRKSIELNDKTQQLGNGKLATVILIKYEGSRLWIYDENEAYIINNRTEYKKATIKEIEDIIRHHLLSELKDFNSRNEELIQDTVAQLNQIKNPISKYALYDKIRNACQPISHYFEINPQTLSPSKFTLPDISDYGGEASGNLYFATINIPRLEYAYLRYSCPVVLMKPETIDSNIPLFESPAIVISLGGGCHLIDTDAPYYFASNCPALVLIPNQNFIDNNLSIYHVIAWLKSNYSIWSCLKKSGNTNIYDPKIFKYLLIPAFPEFYADERITEKIKTILELENKYLGHVNGYLSDHDKFPKDFKQVCENHNNNVSALASELEKIIKELLSIEDNEDTMIIDDLKSKSIFCYDGAKESTYELMC